MADNAKALSLSPQGEAFRGILYRKVLSYMQAANNWKDYEIIDCSSGEKLERWGEYVLLRPDPQVIWNTKKSSPYYKKLNAHYHRSNKGGGEWEFFDLPEQWTISYPICDKKLTFNLKPFAFKHTGLFPEQAVNWDWFSSIINKEINIENLNTIFHKKLFINKTFNILIDSFY